MSRPRGACARSRPFRPAASQMISPREGSLRPAISRSAVDLPQPDGPSTETNSPGRTARLRSSSASVPLANLLATPRRATTDGPPADRSDDGECDGNLAPFDWPQPAAGTIPLFAPFESGGRPRFAGPSGRSGIRGRGALSVWSTPPPTITARGQGHSDERKPALPPCPPPPRPRPF